MGCTLMEESENPPAIRAQSSERAVLFKLEESTVKVHVKYILVLKIAIIVGGKMGAKIEVLGEILGN